MILRAFQPFFMPKKAPDLRLSGATLLARVRRLGWHRRCLLDSSLQVLLFLSLCAEVSLNSEELLDVFVNCRIDGL